MLALPSNLKTEGQTNGLACCTLVVLDKLDFIWIQIGLAAP